MTAWVEVGVGLALLVVPSVVLGLLLGVDAAESETLLVGRIAGGALIALGVASGVARREKRCATHQGLLVGLLIYNGLATMLLGYAGCARSEVGIALWPAVILHAGLALWCARCLGATDHA